MRVAVFGAGYAGVVAARRLEQRLPERDDVVVVDESGHHLVQHELHRVVRRPSVADAITIPLEELLDRATVLRARVTGIDPERGVATLTDPDADAPAGDGDEDGDGDGAGESDADPGDRGDDRLHYDAGIVCLGAETAFYDLPGVREHATPLKRLDHAHEIRERFLAGVAPDSGVDSPAPDAETARETEPDGDGNDDDGGDDGADDDGESDRGPDPHRVVVGGAGLSGVQVAGELAALADERGADARIVLVEMAGEVAPTFPDRFQSAVRSELDDRGIDVRTGWTVRRADPGAVVADRGRIDCDQLVWTGGIRGDPAVGTDRPTVGHDLRLAGSTFAAGDAVRVLDRDGRAVPDSSQTAIRQAPVAAENAARVLDTEDGFRPRLESYGYDELGWIVSVGDGAVAQVGPTVWRGTAAKAMKTVVGAGYLSSVGAVREAVDLVNEEVGIAPEVESRAPVDD